MAKSPTAALKAIDEKAKPVDPTKTRVPGKDGAVGVKDTPPSPAAPPIFTTGEVVMVPVSRSSLSQLGKPDQEAVSELTRTVEQYCQTGASVSDPHAIVLTNEQRKEMIRLFGSDFKTGDDVVRAIRKLVSIHLDFLEIGEVDLPPQLLVRLKTRCHNQDKEPEIALKARRDVGKKAIIEGLEIFVGLR